MQAPIRILIVDDEQPCREALRIFLQEGCPEAEIVGEAGSLSEAKLKTEALLPDLILLDVDLGDGSGFDLLDHFPQPTFKVIFTTAHNEFALKAFRYSALDYLLKPVDPAELISAVQKLNSHDQKADYTRQLIQLRYHASTQRFDRITLKTGDGLIFIATTEILRLEAQGNYSFVFLENGERHLAAQSLAGFEQILPAAQFFRAHQSHIVNTEFVRKLAKEDGDSLLMTDKSIIPLARRRKEAFIGMMKDVAKN